MDGVNFDDMRVKRVTPKNQPVYDPMDQLCDMLVQDPNISNDFKVAYLGAKLKKVQG
jgi:hypothetical protein